MMAETVVTVDPPNRAGGSPAGAGGAAAAATAGGGGGQTKPESNLNWLKFNTQYFITIPGILKIVQVVFGIICMACASPALIGGTHFFLFVVVTSFIATLLWTFVYLLGIREVLNLAINWILTELINTGIATLLYFIAFIVQLASWSNLYGHGRGSNIAAGVFGLFNFLAYTAGTYFLYVEHRSAAV
ncbi:CKLF-like MARVEL transmembrane domain-containing protein 4 [Anopheles darlingi]|uniref:Putative member of chemokine-like factor super family n=1 Tax=Anopheles darlingi TaxID=43151 RepID=A0A2M4CRS3_ANODA|nr:CKLF-like MARVEL transmembrane domain-containing protein 4 [Anopheles darlingi]XP_049548734.1 CKLF-like MARVEL transmembrane domain-containing protein 4 [Anopheles darlingi]